MESLQIQQPSNHSDFSCPICLQTVTLPVETNCGHLFCGSCLITYWKHSPWLGAIICPLCRQKVVVLDNISCEKLHDKPSKQIVHDIRAYNRRFSGQPRPGDPKEVPGADLQLSETKGIALLTEVHSTDSKVCQDAQHTQAKGDQKHRGLLWLCATNPGSSIHQ